jgi:macrolide-specific efflux system membrane fusion protein
MDRMAREGWSMWRLAAVVAALAVVGVVARGCWPRKSAGESMRRVEAERRALHVTRTATGGVTPQNRVEVKPPIAGRIEEVLVREGDAVAKGQVLAWMSSAERAALLDAARAQGEEAIARWEAAYKAAPLTAPLEGTLIVRAVEPGQTVTPSDPVVVIADRLIVKAQVDETDIGAIRVGQPATITLDAYPDQEVPAHVDHVAFEATTVNNVTVYEVDVLPDEVPEVMRSGMTANVTVLIADRPDALVVPSEAVQRDDGASVLVPGPRGQPPARRSVELGMTDGKWVEIVSGLQAGDVVLAPSLRLPKSSGGPRGSPLSPMGGRGRREQQRRER